MKKFLILLSVALSILCLGSAAMAEGFTIYHDYGSLETADYLEYLGETLDSFTIGAEYDLGSFIVGGFYSIAFGGGIDDEMFLRSFSSNGNIWAVYGGYTFLSRDTFSLAGIGGYMRAAFEMEEGEGGNAYLYEDKYTGIVAGLKGALSIRSFSITGLCLIGINPEYESYTYVYNWDEEYTYTPDDVSLSYFELKGAYQFNDSLGVYLGYRSIKSEIEGDEGSADGFMAGIQYKF